MVEACATALAEDASLSGWGREGKRTGYFLLSSTGSGRRRGRMRLVAGRHRREVPPSSLPVPVPVPQHTHLEAPRHPHSPVSPAPPPPSHCSPSGRRLSGQPARRSAAQQTVVPGGGQCRPRRVRAAAQPHLEARRRQWLQRHWLQVELRAHVTPAPPDGESGGQGGHSS